MSAAGPDDEYPDTRGNEARGNEGEFSPDPGPHHEPVYAPTPVNVSCGLWGVASVFLIAGFALTVVRQDRIVADFAARDTAAAVSTEQLADGVTTAVWGLLIGAVAYAGLLALFAYKAREGTRSARSVLTVLTVALLLAQFVLFPNTLTVLACGVAVVALVLLYLPSVALHFPRIPKSLS